MAISIKHCYAICCVAWLCISPCLSFAQDTTQVSMLSPGPDMDLSIKYFHRETTRDGVLHENSYEETMMRRNGHVWTQRVLPDNTKNSAMHPSHEHKDFNYLVLPRHVSYDGIKTTVEFVDIPKRELIYIAPTEYENVNFDGSWLNTYCLINPQYIAAMPLSSIPSTVAHSQWHELNKNGLFQRVLWDEKMSIPLVIESGDLAGTFLQRVKVHPRAKTMQSLPWNKLQGYVQKEYSDFLD